ncbi:hypothetical protein Oweho_3238 [Owenweeksia hongkongensis DSM 17368]|uniref:Uncharacterized protein n=1 Tax=Owenweeksia hongkongensis (strain DSM 17368 / CIP 108786 / JCM 12287 / NRRL B-23963 / UST20020801) TaxID=926562 RepID=G8R489_OWEHD|nr:hypothetical protein [Owenweeksia hongkongensis]AEV34189.1 hypothetical protein Oweho_3238 [Owenweeksia hongkongensis DSM 17368]
MAELLTPEEARYIRDLAMLDFIKNKNQIEALPFDSDFTEAEKAAIAKHLQKRQKLSDAIINKPFNKLQP